MPEPALLRIGELSRRSGVSPELLRAWERRYGLLQPTRSQGGLRLYSLEDLERVRRMQQHLARGLAAAEAASLAAEEPPAASGNGSLLGDRRDELTEAVAAFDEARVHAVLDSVLAMATTDTVLATLVVPYLHELGERWERGEASVAEEHFASAVLRGRLLGLARGWGRGLGPAIVLACAPGEQHDLGLIAFGLALRARGWRIVFLGPDTPIASVGDAVRASDAALAVVSAVTPVPFHEHLDELRTLAGTHRLALGGAGAADAELDLDVEVLGGDPVAEADRVTSLVAAR
ncbi:MAG TPA: MerR family transcriptional regulator [Gaiella sp.]|jgi:DNA-binding transcriptional MerR regulator|nr:MerR family transcriptional regulator [Gaiella sp.]